MGWGAAANAQNQATQMAMMAQAQQAAQAQNALQQGQAQAAAALRESQAKGVEGYQPYQQAGVSATNRLAQLFGAGGEYTQMPTLAQLQMDPGYAFREQQGMQAVNRTAAAQAGLQSGSALKAAQRFGQDMASQEYGNAYNRFMANRAAATQGLQSLYGGGLTAAQGIGNVYAGTGTNLANVYTGTGQNLAQNYQNLGQGIGQGYANMGATNASAYMGPTNLLAQLAGQGIQAGAMMYGAGKPSTGSRYLNWPSF